MTFFIFLNMIILLLHAFGSKNIYFPYYVHAFILMRLNDIFKSACVFHCAVIPFYFQFLVRNALCLKS